jgi:hypothetical protein
MLLTFLKKNSKTIVLRMEFNGMKAIIIPGARKSGTSSLFNIIASCKQVHRPENKETMFFNLKYDYIRKNIEWYTHDRTNGANSEKYWIDASTLYLFDENSAHKIKSFIPSPKIIVVLREPISRTYSAFWEMKKKVPSVERRSFASILREMYKLTKRTGWSVQAAEKEILRKSMDDNLIDSEYVRGDYLNNLTGFPDESHIQDKVLPFRYFTNSLYSKHLKVFRSTFEDLLVLKLEDLKYNTEDQLNKIANFLDMKVANMPLHLPHKNETKIPKSKLAKTFIKLKRCISYHKSIFGYLQKYSILRKIRQLLFDEKTKMSEEQRELANYVLRDECDFYRNA